MTRSIHQFYTRKETGEIVPNAEVTVNFAGGAEAPIYDAATGGSLITQPLIATASAKAVFYIEPGVYDIESKDPILLTTATFAKTEIGVSRGSLTESTSVDFYFATTEDLINHTFDSALVTGQISESQGYSGKGLGGAQWQFLGVTGQTPSQTPAQLGDALLNDASGNQWALVKGAKGDIRKVGALTTVLDNHDAIIAMHNSLNDGDTLLIPDGVFFASAVVTTKRLNHVITGELRRAAATVTTDSVLEINGDRSTLYGGGVVSWNEGAGSDNGRGEAIRINGDTVYATNVTGADTFSTTGNGWFVNGENCVLESCRALNCSYAGIRTNMGGLDVNDEPTGEMVIDNFVADNCLRGWVNNRHAACISIDHFQVKNVPVNGQVQLLGETGDDIKFNKLIITNTFIHEALDVATGALVKFVGIKEVNLTNCDFNTMGVSGIIALSLQNEHIGTDTYQENTLNAINCKFTAFERQVMKADHQNQWRVNTTNCHFISTDGTGFSDMIDLAASEFWHSTDDTFETVANPPTDLVKVEDMGDGATRRFSIIRPKFIGPALGYIFRTAGTVPLVGQLKFVGANFENKPTSANWLTNNGGNDAKILISDMWTDKDGGRDFTASASTASGLTAGDYAQGDRVYIKDVGDTGVYLKIKGSTVWRDFS